MKFRNFFFASLLFFSFGHAACAAPTIKEIVSPSGLTAWLVEDRTLPLVAMRFSFNGGVETDAKDKQGLASLTATLMTQGAGPYDAKTFQDKLAAASIHLGFGAGRDFFQGDMTFLRAEKEEAFRLLSLALTQPHFSEEALERAKNAQSAAARFQLADPEWQTRRALFDFVFARHPYGFRALGSSKSLKTIAREDIAAFARQSFSRDNVRIVIVGAITADETAKALDRVFGGLPAKQIRTEMDSVVWPTHPQTVCVPRKGGQTDFFFAAPMMRRSDPDWYAALVANYLLGGGGFESRLMHAVREQGGMTYGISTSLMPMEKASMIAGGFSVQGDEAIKALATMRRVWQDFYENGATFQEVEAAKAYLMGAMETRLTSRASVADMLLDVREKELGLDYFEKRKKLLQAVSADDVMRVLSAWFDPSRLSFAAVGATQALACDAVKQEAEE